MKIDIIIPVFNEGENIEANLDAINKNIIPIDEKFEIYIVYDFEEDNTLPVIKRIAHKYKFPISLVKNEQRGVVNALKKGFASATGDYILVTMADLSDDYRIISRIIELAEKGYDVICPSRYMKGGKLVGGPFIKQLLSRLAGLSLYYIKRIPTHDITNNYRLYKKDLIQNITLESEGGFEIAFEITAKAFLKGYKICEFPSTWWDRTKGESKFKILKWLSKYLKWYFFLLFKRKEVPC